MSELIFLICFWYSQLDIVSLVIEVQVPDFVAELDGSRKRLFQDSMNGPTPDVPIQDIFALYRRTKTLLEMFKAFVPQYVFFSQLIWKVVGVLREG